MRAVCAFKIDHTHLIRLFAFRTPTETAHNINDLISCSVYWMIIAFSFKGKCNKTESIVSHIYLNNLMCDTTEHAGVLMLDLLLKKAVFLTCSDYFVQ